MRLKRVPVVFLCAALLLTSTVFAAQETPAEGSAGVVLDLSVDGKSCVKENNECSGFPCIEGKCLVKPCDEDSDCPNNLCGLHATPTPGYCASIDVK